MNRQNGHILMSSITFLAVTGIVGMAFLTDVAHDAFTVEYVHRELKSLWAAEEGVGKALAILNAGNYMDYGKGFTFAMRSDSVVCRVIPDTLEEYHFTIESTMYNGPRERGDTILTVIVTAGPGPAGYMSSHVWYTKEAGAASFSEYDSIDAGMSGSIVSEEPVNVVGSPRFVGGAIRLGSEGGPQVRAHEKYGGNPYFSQEPAFVEEDLQFTHMLDRVRKKATRKPVVPPGMTAEVTFSGETVRVRYHAANRTEPRRGAARKVEPLQYSTPEYFKLSETRALYFKGDVEVKGTLDGQMTIGAEGSIAITGDLLYDDADPVSGRPAGQSRSLLGLIAGKNIVLAKPLEQAQKDGGIIVSGSLIACDSALVTADPHSGHMGTMRLWGSVVERVHGTIGFIRGLKLGYTAKRWHYDDRLGRLVPPLFPPMISREGALDYQALHWKRIY